MNSPLVSIIVPAYNCAKYIDRTINSVINQDYNNWELLICDDCSSDNTIKILSAYKTDPRIQIYKNDRNKGKVLTVNFLLTKTRGEFISILDADDYFSKEKISLQVNFLYNNPEYGLCGCNYASVNEINKIYSISNYPLTDQEIRDYISSHSLKDFPILCPSVLIRRRILDIEGGYRDFFIKTCIAEDIDLILRLMQHSKVANIKHVGYFYTFNTSSLTRRVHFSIHARHLHDIVAYMAKQRLEEGADFLQKSDVARYEKLIQDLSIPYRKDKGLLYRKIVIEYAINKNGKYAKMYFKRLLKLTGLNISLIKTWCMMHILLAFNYDTLLKIKKITKISHLSSKI